MANLITLPSTGGNAIQTQLTFTSSQNIIDRVSGLTRDASNRILPQSLQVLSAAEQRAITERQECQLILEARMINANTYDAWAKSAEDLDELLGHNEWKQNDVSDEYYNPALIETRLRLLDDARLRRDVPDMMRLVRTSLSRDIGGIGNSSLYNHSHVGTKRTVERFLQASVKLVEGLVEQTDLALPAGLTNQDVLENLQLARKNFGRSALVLSGGSVFGMAHIGVLKAIWQRRLLPKIISGTSAGSIVASVICTKKDEEIPGVLEMFAQGDLSVFTDKDNPDSWYTHLKRMLQYGTWHDNRHISKVMQKTLGDLTFREGFNRTGRILNITVSSKSGLQLPALLNYLTAPDVIIWSAVVASCSVPGVFDPRPLLVRDALTGKHIPWDPAKQLWIDGSLDSDIPVERLGELFGVNHFIVSQANPHIAVFVSDEDRAGDRGLWLTSGSLAKRLSEFVSVFVGSEVETCLENFVDLGVLGVYGTTLIKMLRQQYTGDINIIPKMSLKWASHLIKNPTEAFMLEACQVGERTTWPILDRIKHSLAVELALDSAVNALNDRRHFSESQVDLRRIYTGSTELGIQKSEAKAHKKHQRRASGGSLQLSAHRRQTMNSMEPIMSEESQHESDPERNGSSLNERRGFQPMHMPIGPIPFMVEKAEELDLSRGPYRGPIKQNSLHHLPLPKSPNPSPGSSRKALQGFGFGNALAPFTRANAGNSNELAAENSDEDEGDLSPLLSMKLRRGGSPVEIPDQTEKAAEGHREELSAFADVEENEDDASAGVKWTTDALSSPGTLSETPTQSEETSSAKGTRTASEGKGAPGPQSPLGMFWN